VLRALSRNTFEERSSSLFQQCGDLLMDEAWSAVLLTGINRCRIKDMEAPLSNIVSKPLDKSRYDRASDGFDGVPLKGEGLREELAREKNRMGA